jgi:hypothetical protein
MTRHSYGASGRTGSRFPGENSPSNQQCGKTPGHNPELSGARVATDIRKYRAPSGIESGATLVAMGASLLTARRNGSNFSAIGGHQGATTPHFDPPPFPSFQEAFQNGPQRSRARPYLARRSEPFTARTVLKGSGWRGKAGP